MRVGLTVLLLVLSASPSRSQVRVTGGVVLGRNPGLRVHVDLGGHRRRLRVCKGHYLRRRVRVHLPPRYVWRRLRHGGFRRIRLRAGGYVWRWRLARVACDGSCR